MTAVAVGAAPRGRLRYVVPFASIPAVISFSFPATFGAGGFAVRWETLAGAMAGLLAGFAVVLMLHEQAARFMHRLLPL